MKCICSSVTLSTRRPFSSIHNIFILKLSIGYYSINKFYIKVDLHSYNKNGIWQMKNVTCNKNVFIISQYLKDRIFDWSVTHTPLWHLNHNDQIYWEFRFNDRNKWQYQWKCQNEYTQSHIGAKKVARHNHV